MWELARGVERVRGLEIWCWLIVCGILTVAVVQVVELARPIAGEMRTVRVHNPDYWGQATVGSLPHSAAGAVQLVHVPPATSVFNGTLVISHPTLVQRLALGLPQLVTYLFAASGAVILARMARTARLEDPFLPRNVRRLQWLAVLAGLAPVASIGLEFGALRWLVSSTAAARADVHLSGGTNPWPALTISMVCVAVAEIFRHGIRLRTDAEGLV